MFILQVKEKHIKKQFDKILEEIIPIKTLKKKDDLDQNDKRLDTFGSIKEVIDRNEAKNDKFENEFKDLMFNTIEMKYVTCAL